MEAPTVVRIVEGDFADILERFGDRIEQTEDGCWEWTGGINSGGYPAIQVNGRTVQVSRLVYEMAYGPISPGRRTRHRCRNRRCIHPAHLGLNPFPIPMEAIAARFWSKVEKNEDGCWEWTGKHARGYAYISIANRWRRAHRVAYELVKGPIPEGAYICHTCDNPGCVRPDHLYAGTPADNMRDKQAKGRQTRGEDFPQAKLTDAKVIEMRREYSRKHTPRAVFARRYGVAEATIKSILCGKSWRHAVPALQAA